MNIAINGFGRIGRAAFKILLERTSRGKDLNIVGINDLGDSENLAYLLKYDSVYGVYEKSVSFDDKNIVVNGKKYFLLSEKDPKNLPWGKLGVDVVFECTGIFKDREGAKMHLEAGAKKVVISAPTKDETVKTYVIGSSHFESKEDVISCASCTTNSVTPVLSVMEKAFGVDKAMLTTVHAYTASQSIVDSPNKKDFRLGRAGAWNIIPSSTGAAKATAKAMPFLDSIFDGVSVRVPVACGSISDLTMLTKRNTSVDNVNDVFIKAMEDPLYKNILKFTKAPIVSSDILKSPFSSIVDGLMTRVVGGNLVKIMAWYDNEWGYSNRLVDLGVYGKF